MSIEDSLTMSTNTISTIHSLLVTLPSFVDFLYFKRWENPIIDDPKLAGSIWACAIAYFLVDLIGHLSCYVAYNSKTVTRRWDSIIHHLVAIIGFLCIQIPKPIHFWGIFSLIMGSELSTIFLNLQWYGKHFKNEKLKKISKICFIISWMFVRLPIFLYIAYFFITNWERITNEVPSRIYIAAVTTLSPAILLQIIWTVLIIWKMRQTKTRKNHMYKHKSVHGTNISLSAF
eukprot:157087_1